MLLFNEIILMFSPGLSAIYNKAFFLFPFPPKEMSSVGLTVDSRLIIPNFSNLYIPGLPVGFIFFLPLGYVNTR